MATLLEFDGAAKPSPFEGLMKNRHTNQQTASVATTASQKPKITPISQGPKTFVVQSNLLDRLKDFLPQIKQANEKLSQDIKDKGANQFSVEADDDESEQYIEMNLGLGVLEAKPENADEKEVEHNITEFLKKKKQSPPSKTGKK